MPQSIKMIGRPTSNVLGLPRIILLTGLILLCLIPLSSLWYIYPRDQSFYFADTLWKKQQGGAAFGFGVDPGTLDDVRNSTLGVSWLPHLRDGQS